MLARVCTGEAVDKHRIQLTDVVLGLRRHLRVRAAVMPRLSIDSGARDFARLSVVVKRCYDDNIIVRLFRTMNFMLNTVFTQNIYTII